MPGEVMQKKNLIKLDLSISTYMWLHLLLGCRCQYFLYSKIMSYSVGETLTTSVLESICVSVTYIP